MSASQAKALRSLAEPIVAGLDCDLEDVVIRQAGKRRLVRIVVDHHSGGLTLDLVASISREIARVLDDSTVLGNSAYVLEVTSPGVDRPLTLPRHWTRAVSRLVRVTPKSGGTIEGRVLSADETQAVLDVDGAETPVAYADVARAVVQVEFTRIDEPDIDETDLDKTDLDETDLDEPDIDETDLDETDLDTDDSGDDAGPPDTHPTDARDTDPREG
jgi:ribosome maturation factor RimP